MLWKRGSRKSVQFVMSSPRIVGDFLIHQKFLRVYACYSISVVTLIWCTEWWNENISRLLSYSCHSCLLLPDVRHSTRSSLQLVPSTWTIFRTKNVSNLFPGPIFPRLIFMLFSWSNQLVRIDLLGRHEFWCRCLVLHVDCGLATDCSCESPPSHAIFIIFHEEKSSIDWVIGEWQNSLFEFSIIRADAADSILPSAFILTTESQSINLWFLILTQLIQ